MGMNRSNRDLKGQTEVLDVGRQTVSWYDKESIINISVMKKDTSLLVRFLVISLGLILLPNYAYK